MAAVFISYRRDDSEGQARALFRDLCEILGKQSVFMDVDSIALGRDFREVLHEHLAASESMLVLIGARWLTAEDSQGRRLDHPDDYVRQEIAAALKRDIPVTPVLVQGAKMPNPSQLPEDIKKLAFRNGFELSHTRWNSDVRELIQRLGLRSAPHEPPKSARRSQRTRWGASVAAVVIALVLWAVAKEWSKRVIAPAQCAGLYGTYDVSLQRSSGDASCGPTFGSRWTLSGNADCTDFRVIEAGSNITFRGTISSNGKFKAAGSGAMIEGTVSGGQITGTDTNPTCSFTVSGQR